MIGFIIHGTRTTGYQKEHLTLHICKINPRRTVDLNIKGKIIKLLENRGKIYDLGYRKIF